MTVSEWPIPVGGMVEWAFPSGYSIPDCKTLRVGSSSTVSLVNFQCDIVGTNVQLTTLVELDPSSIDITFDFIIEAETSNTDTAGTFTFYTY